jgi:hypothetical protein
MGVQDFTIVGTSTTRLKLKGSLGHDEMPSRLLLIQVPTHAWQSVELTQCTTCLSDTNLVLLRMLSSHFGSRYSWQTQALVPEMPTSILRRRGDRNI